MRFSRNSERFQTEFETGAARQQRYLLFRSPGPVLFGTCKYLRSKALTYKYAKAGFQPPSVSFNDKPVCFPGSLRSAGQQPADLVLILLFRPHYYYYSYSYSRMYKI